ncbi:3-oxoacyl-ACP synthase III family protein [Flavobacterium lacus]|uniref:3-oxoacyl-[acyl-carrier-protein] synthase-3 n=1 Tax=Flavobacterium lacus TaxID=1353778 RepID=A0A328WTQ4_9FLAO|nr:ketoacyl-ACP synthase III [Flavobacterium lacus]RAR47224.1 3-oxoacyl-[acyl-carrier-protein] synthase-3 [Flavobacterium lacus]
MAQLIFNNVGIVGLSAAVPKNTIDNYAQTDYFSATDVKDIVDKVGIKERRFAPADMCASDLCFAAAEKLISDLQLDKDEIDLLVFVSQTPDYRMPATAILLQHRLGLGKHTAAFDISLGCSAFVYGLSIVYGLLQTGGFRKALLLDGETRSRIYSPKDRKTAFLFGDGGVAAILEQHEKFGPSYFSLHSDGSLSDLIKMDAGGYRNPSTVATLTEKIVDEHGTIRSDEHGYMNGSEVFNFVLNEIPSSYKSLLAFSNNTNETIDYAVFHQANDYMNSYLAKKLKLDTSKVPSCIAQFGNTSSVSIPLTIVSQLKDKLMGRKKLMLCGFGVGMSWATAQVNVEDCHVSTLVEI